MNYNYKRLFEILDRDFYDKIKNKDVKNGRRLMICFSGIPGSGKTTLARKIEERYQGVRLTKDDARTLVYQNEEIKDVHDVEDILDEYVEKMMEKVAKLPNGLVVMDASVDRHFDKYREWADKYDYKRFLIKVETPSEVITERWSRDKDESTYKWFMEQLGRWTNDFESFGKQTKPDFVWKNNDNSQLPVLYAELDEILHL
jgi:predicted kinase